MSLATSVLLWLAAGYSVGWYVTLTDWGARGWPLPAPESAAAQLAYGSAHLGPGFLYQTVFWLVLFPLAGYVWVGLQCLTGPYFGAPEVKPALASRPFALSSATLILMGVVATFLVWRNRDQFVWNGIYLVSERFGPADHWPWLGPGYVVLAAGTLAIQLVLHRKVFGLQGGRAWAHFGLNLILTLCVLSGMAALLSRVVR